MIRVGCNSHTDQEWVHKEEVELGVGINRWIPAVSLSQIERPFDGNAPAPGEGGGSAQQPLNYSSLFSQLLKYVFSAHIHPVCRENTVYSWNFDICGHLMIEMVNMGWYIYIRVNLYQKI